MHGLPCRGWCFLVFLNFSFLYRGCYTKSWTCSLLLGSLKVLKEGKYILEMYMLKVTILLNLFYFKILLYKEEWYLEFRMTS